MPDVHRLLARDYRFFEFARKAACESTFKVHVGAVGIYRGRVVASAASSDKTHPLQDKYNSKYRKFNQVGLSLPKVHAEIGVLAKLKRLDIPMSDVRIYVYRTCKSREHGMARPCPACMHALKAAGVRSVFYTTDVGYAHEFIEIV